MTAIEHDAIDAFAGPGGWDTGLRMLGWTGHILGIENDPAACATARAAGHDRMLADVSTVDPALWWGIFLAIFSPPCQAWSRAGKGLGLLDQPRIWQHLRDVERAGEWIDYPRNQHPVDPVAPDRMPDGNTWWDTRSPLVLEVLRWVMLARPRNVACEQVPDVLPFWQELARILRGLGYSAVAFELTAEEHGVPQTRRRAFLIASLDRTVSPPPPTHQRYRKGEPARASEPDLFGEALLPWVSMAEALGWTVDALVGHPRLADTPSNRTGSVDPDDDRVIELDGKLYRARDLRAADQPAQTLTEKVRSWEVRTGNNTMRHKRNGSRAGDGGVAAYGRPVTDPAPTLDTAIGRKWILYERTQGGYQRVDIGRPARTVRPVNPSGAESAPRFGDLAYLDHDADFVPSVEVRSEHWTATRTATTVRGDPRVWPPGHKVNDADRRADRRRAESYGDRAGTNAVRVSVAEAGVLQSFPPDYPWRGTQTAQYRQVGDAVPPLLAAAVLRSLIC